MPENEARILLKAARDANKWVIGPATVGGIQAGILFLFKFKFKFFNTLTYFLPSFQNEEIIINCNK